MSYLQFNEIPNPGKKTKRWEIYNSECTLRLGWIQFHAPWRKYVWTMEPNTIFDLACTEIIVEFLKVHKDDRQ